MGKIVVITHEYDRLLRKPLFRPARSGYMIHAVLRELERLGHQCIVARGLARRPGGDMAIVHVNATVTPAEYLDYAATFPVSVNLAMVDISKRHISQALVTPGDGWEGPVILKSTLNHGGYPERRLNARARLRGRRPPFPGATLVRNYTVFDRANEISPAVFANPNLVVERFMPEVTEDGHALRHWIFAGDYDYCVRCVSKEKLVKGSGVFRSEACTVPDDLRRRRHELGCDYGKFDFVVHDGRSYLLDANKTPGSPPTGIEVASPSGMASGFERMLRR